MRPFLERCTYDRALTTLLFLSIVLVCGLTPMQTDTWWQLRAGLDMWRSGHVLLTDIYSHTAAGAFWPNHEWLAEIVYFLCYRSGGLPLVTLFAAALIAGGWSVSWRLSRGPVRDAFLWTALALVPASLWWEPRPHAFSLLLLPLSIFLIVRRRASWLPLVFVVWANCHGGVLLGLVLVVAALAAQAAAGQIAWRRALVVSAGCMLAMTATPLGARFWTEIPRSLQRIRLYPLDEWRRPGLLELQVLPFWAIAAGFCLLMVRRATRIWMTRAVNPDVPVYMSAALLLPAAVLAIRNVGPFLMLAVPAVTSIRSLEGARAKAPARQRPVLNAVLIATSAAAVAATLVISYAAPIDKLRWRPVPAGALSALRECPDNLYNRYDEGGALLWFAPGRKVFLDGRQDPYPPALVLEQIAMETGRLSHEPVFERFGIRCAYLPVGSPVAVRLSAGGWRALYRDREWVVLTGHDARGASARAGTPAGQ